jgi:hypothetical protein
MERYMDFILDPNEAMLKYFHVRSILKVYAAFCMLLELLFLWAIIVSNWQFTIFCIGNTVMNLASGILGVYTLSKNSR